MSKHLIRAYKKHDVAEIKEQLLIYGDTSGCCAKCNKMDLKLETKICPECNTEFKFIAFRKPQSHMPKINRLFEQAPSQTIIDFNDYQKCLGQNKANDIFNM